MYIYIYVKLQITSVRIVCELIKGSYPQICIQVPLSNFISADVFVPYKLKSFLYFESSKVKDKKNRIVLHFFQIGVQNSHNSAYSKILNLNKNIVNFSSTEKVQDRTF